MKRNRHRPYLGLVVFFLCTSLLLISIGYVPIYRHFPCRASSPPFNQPSRWKVVNPAGDASFSIASEQISIFAPAYHDLWDMSNYLAPRVLLQDTYDTNFIATVRVQAQPLGQYQGAGLLIWQDDQHFVRLEQASIDKSGMTYAVFRTDINKMTSSISSPFPLTTSQDIKLQVRYLMNRFEAYTSDNGGPWVLVGSTNFPQGTFTIGLSAINAQQEGSEAPFTASFQNFAITC